MQNDRYLLIKAWSNNLWSDIDHVLGQLLIAEITDRVPVVYWSTHCLINGFIQTNGFELYFEPVSRYTIFDLVREDYTYYPAVWNRDNLLVEDQGAISWAGRNVGDFVCSKANVLVSDVYFNVYDIIPFIKKSNPAYGMTSRQIYGYLFGKYIRIKPDIAMEIQGFFNSWLKDGGPLLAVHVRRAEKDKAGSASGTRRSYLRGRRSPGPQKKEPGSESNECEKAYKVSRRRIVMEPNKPYHAEINRLIEKYGIRRIFLLTDCAETVGEYQKTYGSKVVFTDCKRLSADDEEAYLENPMINRRRGIEVIKDTYLASMCDFFIGNEFSDLSHAVTRIKEWPDSNIKLLYWKSGNRKYPINREFYKKREGGSRIKKTLNEIKKYFEKKDEV